MCLLMLLLPCLVGKTGKKDRGIEHFERIKSEKIKLFVFSLHVIARAKRWVNSKHFT